MADKAEFYELCMRLRREGFTVEDELIDEYEQELREEGRLQEDGSRDRWGRRDGVERGRRMASPRGVEHWQLQNTVGQIQAVFTLGDVDFNFICLNGTFDVNVKI